MIIICFVTDKFQNVCVAGDKIFPLQRNSPQLLNWEEYGLRIAIPHEAVPLYDTVDVAITALVSGEFIFPEDTELVSAVYAISVSKPLLEPVQLEIQHCVFIEKPSHSNYLSFATAPSDQPPYQFKPVKGGEFPIGSRYGSICINEFSLWTIMMNFIHRRNRIQPLMGNNESTILSHSRQPSSFSSSNITTVSAPTDQDNSSFEGMYIIHACIM